MNKVLILDFGSQLTQLITRRVREAGIYSQIVPFDYDVEKIRADKSIKALIFSGGPNSVYEENSPQLNKELLELNLPILGLCYGLQIISHSLGGKVEPSQKREYGRAFVDILDNTNLFEGLGEKEQVWMSHGDHSTKVPTEFEILASTNSCPIAAMGNTEKRIYGIQFHPEVYHTPNGSKMIQNFLYNIAGLKKEWDSQHVAKEQIEKIKNQVGNQKVICGLSGGVDSSVTAALISKAIGKQLHCLFVDHGLLRAGEREEVEKAFRSNFETNLTIIDASELFLKKLERESDPEKKRKIIGNTFIEVFEIGQHALEFGKEFLKIDSKTCVLDENGDELKIDLKKPLEFKFLAQGTLYPDVVESVSAKGGPSQTIKSHHNVGGLPEDLKFKLVEPLKELFKDEVREVGKYLGLPDEIVQRHPFPGPGLGIRVISNITFEKLEILRKTDKIFTDELKNTINENTGKTLYQETWQAFAVLTEVKSVGVMGDGRTYERLVGLRAVTATDGMTADWAHLPYNFLAKVSNRIINEVKGVNRVAYDISSKPPATIEWE